MADFTTFVLNYNSGAGTDASPVWTGTAIAFGGSAGANEIRFCPTGTGTTTTASASWPFVTRPTSGTATIPEAWAYSADAVGLKIVTYDATNAKSNVLRWNWDAVGTFTSSPQFSAFGDNTHGAPVAGTQPGAFSGSPIVNGHATDTTSTSYLKINAYGQTSVPATNVAAGVAGSLPTVTMGSAGILNVTAGANWLNTGGNWQSAQGWTQAVSLNATPTAVTAQVWNWTMALFTGVNMSTAATILPVVTFQYTFS